MFAASGPRFCSQSEQEKSLRLPEHSHTQKVSLQIIKQRIAGSYPFDKFVSDPSSIA